MSNTFWITLALIWPFKIIRWPLGCAFIIWNYIFTLKGDVLGAFLISIPALLVFLLIDKRIREYREIDSAMKLVEQYFGKHKPSRRTQESVKLYEEIRLKQK